MRLWRSVLLVSIAGAFVSSFSGCGGNASDGSGGAASGGASGASGKAGSAGSSTGGSSGSSTGGSAGSSTGGSAGSSTGGSGATGGVSTGGSAGASGSGGVPENYFACGDTSECMVRESDCCVLCGPDSASAAIAFNRAYSEQISTILCEDHPDPCPVADCALRPTYVLPFCIEGRCQAIDIREDLLTSCGTDEQCQLRWGTVCCEACSESPELLVAVNSQVDYGATVCGNQGACPPCAPPPYPSDARAVCNADHHCEVARR
jgi:hypothetical protein